jgi:hypothetical protein
MTAAERLVAAGVEPDVAETLAAKRVRVDGDGVTVLQANGIPYAVPDGTDSLDWLAARVAEEVPETQLREDSTAFYDRLRERIHRERAAKRRGQSPRTALGRLTGQPERR